MQVLLVISGLFYMAIIPVLFMSWLEFFRHDQGNLTDQEQQLSMIVIAIASVFWVVALPFAYLELLDKFRCASRASRLYQSMIETQKSQTLLPNDEVQFQNH